MRKLMISALIGCGGIVFFLVPASTQVSRSLSLPLTQADEASRDQISSNDDSPKRELSRHREVRESSPLDALSDSDAEIRRTALLQLQTDRREQVSDAILRIAQYDESPIVRETAVYCLQNRPKRADISRVLKDLAVGDGVPEVRQASITALGAYLDRETESFLLDLANWVGDRDVRLVALFVLQQAKEPSTLSSVRKISADENDPQVAKAAVEVELAMTGSLTPQLLEHGH